MDSVNDFLSRASGLVWGGEIWGGYDFFGILIPLLLGTGLYLTFRLSAIQFRTLGRALRLGLLKRKDPQGEGDITHYEALTTALAATVGVGNIAGVAGAIYLGGPGALFWMWITGLVGMATKYCEAFLGVKFRHTDAAGEQSGGPQTYLTRGIKGRLGPILGVTFAVFAILASFGIGNMTQSNTVASTADDSWGVPTWLTGLILTVAAAAVILGGIKVIGRVTAAFVPLMIVIYLLAGTWVLLANVGELPDAIELIFTDAFTGTSAVGGFLGAGFLLALRYGVARGIFSNESGLGTGGIAAAAAKTTHPVRQALVSMTQTFIDTIVVVTFTGLVIVVTGAWQSGRDGAPMTSLAFQDGLPGGWGDNVVALSVAFFAFSTLLGWSYYGERNVERLVGRVGVMPYRAVFVVVVFVGAVTELETVWTFSDVMNGLMALPNLIGLLILAGLVARETREYLNSPEGMMLKEPRRGRGPEEEDKV
ncbi:alanine/glycine:cation symporter family protein [Phytoactinopolyspora halotolerans]|uniref:Alanine:cation symporter family protein n=1 Tax=Phytoactinopolyspora halotolerans TaxID=1981512 RepID=A0A6L9S9S9_9ACTN|nr:sodium:alanine symporter family protein [Phytoactinopolyspora halotolerans]NEE01322.1 alanine:cation symporter family protein [Phytoactinopolyspora halotolerans]